MTKESTKDLTGRVARGVKLALFETLMKRCAALSETLCRVYDIALTNGWTEVQDVICDRHPELLIEGSRPEEVVEAVNQSEPPDYEETVEEEAERETGCEP